MFDANFIERFLDKVERIPFSGCWIWMGALFSTGYGAVGVRYSAKRAHRVSWEIHNGEILGDLLVLHKCDIRSCVNPNHLYLGDKLDNAIDATNRRRYYTTNQTQCKRGHEFNQNNTYINPSNGQRVCRICRLEKQREYYA